MEFVGKCDERRVMNLPGGTHPGTERGTMCGFLMVRMLRFVGDRLRRGKAADHKNTEHQDDCERLSCLKMTHRPLLTPASAPNATGVR